MEKITSRFLIVAGLYVSGVTTALLGLMLNYVIPKGGGGRAGEGFLALARHDWADMHAFFALCFVALAITHVVLNRAQAQGHLRKIFPGNLNRAVLATCLAPFGLIVLGWLLALIF
ncbi:MAG: DUF4405 domain-containing protein [Thermodesulfobacteriota bacterium]